MKNVGKANCKDWDLLGDDVVESTRRVGELAIDIMLDPQRNDELAIGLFSDQPIHDDDIEITLQLLRNCELRFMLVKDMLEPYLRPGFGGFDAPVDYDRLRIAKVLRAVARQLENLAIGDAS